MRSQGFHFKGQLNTCYVLPLWRISAKTSPLKFLHLDALNLILKLQFQKLHWSLGFIEISPFHSVSSLFRTYLDKSSKVLTADDNMKSYCAYSSMKGQVGGFQTPGVCLQAFPSFPFPSFLFLAPAPFFARAKRLKSRSSDFLCSPTPQKRLLRRLTPRELGGHVSRSERLFAFIVHNHTFSL